MSPADNYDVSARYYDQAYSAKQDLADISFYEDLARETGGPVLELGCGTGRVLLPIARAGIQIHGVDSSDAMLDGLSASLERETKEVRERVTIFRGDMRSFRGEGRYRLVTIPFRPLQHMHTLEDQVSALQTAAYHLDERGLLALDVFYPKFQHLAAGFGQEVLELEWKAPENPKIVVQRYFRKDRFDKIQQNFELTFCYRTLEEGKLVKEESAALKMTYYTYPHLLALFRMADLEPVAEYGSLAKTPLDNDASEMVFVVRRAGS